MRPCNITPAVILHILNEMRQCNITPIINKENSYTNVILHGQFQKKFPASQRLDIGANTKAPARLGVMPNACPCWGLSLLLPRIHLVQSLGLGVSRCAESYSVEGSPATTS